MAETLGPSEPAVVMSSFQDIDPTAGALEQLKELGIPDGDVIVRSSLPYSAEVLGRPHLKTRLPIISLVAALVGLGTGIFFTIITPYLYIIRVGGQPIVPVPPTALLLYEFIMLALIVGTFGGFLALNRFPASQPQDYDPKLTDGRISLVIHSPADKKADVVAILEAQGGEVFQSPERRRP
jgi:hypothetical protein